VTSLPNHMQCDPCRAVVPLGAHGWETISGPGDDAHLCPTCVGSRDRGELASNPLRLRCTRCGHTPVDGIKQWWFAAGESERTDLVCDDCYDEDQDGITI
jgi:hypothetical protein